MVSPRSPEAPISPSLAQSPECPLRRAQSQHPHPQGWAEGSTPSADVTPANSSPWLLMAIRRLSVFHLETSRLRPPNPPGPPGATRPLPHAHGQLRGPHSFLPRSSRHGPSRTPLPQAAGHLRSAPRPSSPCRLLPGLRAGLLLTLPLAWLGGPGRCGHDARTSSPTQALRCGVFPTMLSRTIGGRV